MEQMGEDEKQRVKKQQEALGPEGLKGKGQDLEQATQENEVRDLITYKDSWCHI